MNDKFQPLDGDDDVLLFDNNNTFTVGEFKDLMSQQFQKKFLTRLSPQTYVWRSFSRTSDIKSD